MARQSKREINESPATRTKRVQRIVELKTSGLFRRSTTVDDLARLWRLPRIYVALLAREASVLVTNAIDAGEIARTLDEALDCLARCAHKCETRGDYREAIVAADRLANHCASILGDSVSTNNGGKISGGDAYRALVNAGWQPPNTLPGLPAPNVMDPELVSFPRSDRVVDVAGSVVDGPVDERCGKQNEQHDSSEDDHA